MIALANGDFDPVRPAALFFVIRYGNPYIASTTEYDLSNASSSFSGFVPLAWATPTFLFWRRLPQNSLFVDLLG